MGVIATSFGVAAVAAVAVSRLSGRRHSSFGMAKMLLLFWCVANIFGAWADPVMDTVGFYVAYFVCVARPKHRWCWGIMGAFAAQLIVHAAFMLDELSYWRMLALNVLCAVQLICVSIPGGIVGAQGLRDLCSRWRHRHPAGALPGAAIHPKQEAPACVAPSGTLKVAATSRHRR